MSNAIDLVDLTVSICPVLPGRGSGSEVAQVLVLAPELRPSLPVVATLRDIRCVGPSGNGRHILGQRAEFACVGCEKVDDKLGLASSLLADGVVDCSASSSWRKNASQ